MDYVKVRTLGKLRGKDNATNAQLLEVISDHIFSY